METDIPTIDAIFVVRFDTRLGNVLEWSDAVQGIELHGVEFSALPSGLHGSSQDVIYFQLEGCVGISVFVNVPSDSVEDRGAQMIAVGILVKPSADTGRCGQVWRHAEFLKSQARRHAAQGVEAVDLASYFAKHKTPQHAVGPSSSSNKRDSYRTRNPRRVSRSFTLSEPLQAFFPSAIVQQESGETDDIPTSHPSHHFLRLVQAMGPSIYVLWKAALLRKRILIYTPPPVESACLSVYNICLMATIPFGNTSISQTKSNERTQPLFCVGIHDIDNMKAIRGGYVACTTDKLFLFKPQLYDILVDLSASTPKSHPRICVVRGTFREFELEDTPPNAVDNRRYFALLQQLGRFRRRQEWMQRRLYAEATSSGTAEENEEATTLQGPEMHALESDGDPATGGFNMSDTLRKMLTGGWWWWYGGDDAEDDDLEPLIARTAAQGQEQELQGRIRPSSSACLQVLQTQTSGSSDTEAIRFFHNLTSTLLSDLGRLISFKTTAAIFDDAEPLFSGAEGDEDEDGGERPVEISKQDIRQLGLDPCKDGEFVQDLARLYFGARVQLQRSELELWCSSVTSCCVPWPR